MPFPAELVREIDRAVDNVLADGALNSQQLTFVHHIQKINAELSQALEPVPQTEFALKRIIPSFGESFLQQQVALFGYAKLLLEHPQSFDGATLSDYQQEQMHLIYQYGQTLHNLTEHIQQTALTDRRRQQHAQAIFVNLQAFFAEEEAILRYFIRKQSVQLHIHAEPSIVRIAPYHLSAFIQHIVTVISHELIENGYIEIHTIENTIHIACTGIDLSADEQDILFKKNGRYAYPKRFINNGGAIHFLRDIEHGATIQLILPT